MYAILRFLFPDKPYTAGNSWLLLAARIIFGGLLMSHGIAKWQNFDALSASFPDPLGVGGGVSLALAIFGEVICSAGFIAGLFYRLALIPMIFTMCVAFFAVHGGDPFAARELALAYLSVYVLMYAAGPGLYAADTLIARRLPKPQPCRADAGPGGVDRPCAAQAARAAVGVGHRLLRRTAAG